MGIRRKNKNIELSIEHITSMIHIKTAKCCSNCPIKLYADDNDTIIFGTGNLITNTIIILPSYDVKAGIDYPTILKILQDKYKEVKGTELLEECYVTRSIKCLNKTDFNLEKDAIKSCINHLYYEIGRIRPSKIIIFDKQLYDFGLYNCNISRFNIKTVISPAVMYYDNENLKNIFMKQLKEAINDS